MYRIGIDVGSTYTKYCVMDESDNILELKAEKTPIRQREYFESRVNKYRLKYPDAQITSCGYGRGNVESIRQVNELSALAKGVNYLCPEYNVVLDIGGQDTKIIRQENGSLKQFFLNDKCAAGSGMFLSNVCGMLDVTLDDIKLVPIDKCDIHLSSVCAVFAQSEIVELIATNVDSDMIVSAVVRQLLTQAKPLIGKVEVDKLLLSGGLANINGIEGYAEGIFGKACVVDPRGQFMAAVGGSKIG